MMNLKERSALRCTHLKMSWSMPWLLRIACDLSFLSKTSRLWLKDMISSQRSQADFSVTWRPSWVARGRKQSRMWMVSSASWRRSTKSSERVKGSSNVKWCKSKGPRLPKRKSDTKWLKPFGSSMITQWTERGCLAHLEVGLPQRVAVTVTSRVPSVSGKKPRSASYARWNKPMKMFLR